MEMLAANSHHGGIDQSEQGRILTNHTKAEMDTVIEVLMDYDNSCKWNPALSKTKVSSLSNDP